MPEPAVAAAPGPGAAPAPALALRPAGPADCRFVWATRNEPSARAASLSSEPIPYADHEQWWAGALADPATLILVVEAPGVGTAGYVRFRSEPAGGAGPEPRPQPSPQPGLAEAEISIALTPATRGRGLGSEAIRQACAHLFAAGRAGRVIARVRPSNAASLTAFAAAGFTPVSAPDADPVVLALERP